MNPLLEKLSRSRDLTVSLVVHFIIVLVLACTVVVKVASAPPDLVAGRILEPDHVPAQPPAPKSEQSPISQLPSDAPAFHSSDTMEKIIQSIGEGPKTFEAPKLGQGSSPGMPKLDPGLMTSKLPAGDLNQIPRSARGAISDTVKSWKRPNDTYDFTAVLAQYDGGDWNSTVRVKDQKVVGGSLPNLLYLMNVWSKDRIRTNEDKVQIMRLDSGELLTVRPPFIFMTGTRDFVLTDAEIENLQKYLRMGGCVWGDSSVPGLRSRFDVAFKREMRRVIPDVDKQFEPLPSNHPLFQEGYFKQVNAVPAGVNFYREPVSVLKLYGEVAVIYTANDYADMWQIGLNSQGEVDLRRNEFGAYVAVNPRLWDYRHTYLANLAPEGKGRESATNLAETYRFGTNVIFHLLTRWDEKLGSASAL